MRKLSLTIGVLLLIASTLSAQEKSNSLYARGLQACLEKDVESYSSFLKEDLRDVVVLTDIFLTNNLPEQFREIRVRFRDDYQLVEKVKALPKSDLKTGIRFHKIFPLRDTEDKLRFAYNTYWFRYSESGGFFTRKKIVFSHSLEGGCHVDIGFDTAQKKFAIEKVKLWGV